MCEESEVRLVFELLIIIILKLEQVAFYQIKLVIVLHERLEFYDRDGTETQIHGIYNSELVAGDQKYIGLFSVAHQKEHVFDALASFFDPSVIALCEQELEEDLRFHLFKPPLLFLQHY